jgi:hypothetical protein
MQPGKRQPGEQAKQHNHGQKMNGGKGKVLVVLVFYPAF